MKKLIYDSRFWLVSLAFWVVIFGSSGCNEKIDYTVEAVENEVDVNNDRPKIRIAMTAAFVSESGVRVYENICKYLSDKTGLEVVLVKGFSYSIVNAMLDSGAVDMGFVCGLPYVLKRELPSSPVRLVVAPVMKSSQYNNQPKYFSYVIVRNDSESKSFGDLKGCNYVFNDEISNSGYNMPRARLVELGETHGFFGKLFRSGSHEESIRMVALGQADASSVDSLVFDYDIVRNPEFARQVKIIERLGPAGIPPLVASITMESEHVDMVKKILVQMKRDYKGKAILDEALIDRFEVVDDGNYDDIRQMKRLAEDAEFMEIK